MSIRINLEIGHEASIRTKKTPEGFTHDWEVFVRGCDGANITFYVEKVVFHLHDTFPKPKRVVKTPPYAVKETGYAGFPLPIDIYLRNKDEPKKIRFNYILDLQQTGPPMLRSQKEKYVFANPNDEFKAQLLKGGGTVVNPTNFHDVTATRPPTTTGDKSPLISKPRLGGVDQLKKHKPKMVDEPPPRISNSFSDLFGPPITKITKISPDPKATLNKDRNSNVNRATDKTPTTTTTTTTTKIKHSPHKEKEREKGRDADKQQPRPKEERDRKKEEKKERSREREREKREKRSPKAQSPSPRRAPTPPKYKEEKGAGPVGVATAGSARKAPDDKERKPRKEKRDKDKEKPAKHKDKAHAKVVDVKESKLKVKDVIKERDPSPAPPPVVKPEKRDRPAKEPAIDPPLKEAEPVERNGQPREKTDERPKHKHKKKEKERRKEGGGGRDRNHKAERKERERGGATTTTTTTTERALFTSPKGGAPGVNDVASDSAPSSPEPKEEPEEKGKKRGEKGKRSREQRKAEREGERRRKRKGEERVEEEEEEPVEKAARGEGEEPMRIAEVEPVEKGAEDDSEAYMNVLRGLQQKIMTLQDNADLQKVVQLIAETGKFEVTTQTFDFDLCLLDRSTINQLRQFFDDAAQ